MRPRDASGIIHASSLTRVCVADDDTQEGSIENTQPKTNTGPPLPGHGLFAVPLGSTGVAFVSESGCKRPQVSEIAPGALLAAWAPPHPDWMNNLLAVATAKELQLFDVQVDESSVNARRPVWAIPIKQCVEFWILRFRAFVYVCITPPAHDLT